jgi:hypothetical protein
MWIYLCVEFIYFKKSQVVQASTSSDDTQLSNELEKFVNIIINKSCNNIFIVLPIILLHKKLLYFELKMAMCNSCQKKMHDFAREEALECIPPKDVLVFGEYKINKNYRNALYAEHPKYTAEEIVGTYLGHNADFPSQSKWFAEEETDSDSDSESDKEEGANESWHFDVISTPIFIKK